MPHRMAMLCTCRWHCEILLDSFASVLWSSRFQYKTITPMQMKSKTFIIYTSIFHYIIKKQSNSQKSFNPGLKKRNRMIPSGHLHKTSFLLLIKNSLKWTDYISLSVKLTLGKRDARSLKAFAWFLATFPSMLTFEKKSG